MDQSRIQAFGAERARLNEAVMRHAGTNMKRFWALDHQAYLDGALPAKTKELIAVAVAHATQCPYCIRGHTELALRKGATEEEVMEAIWVAAEMRAGAAYAHSNIALDEMNRLAAGKTAWSNP
jgi:AhpD family alkylhydroperoxidase